MSDNHFPGPQESYEPARTERLTTQMAAVLDLMGDGAWRTLDEISEDVQSRYGVRCPPASASAQLRHLKKPQFGGHTMLKKHIVGGLYVYRIIVARRYGRQRGLWESA